jgi:hypothetical protein
MVAVGRSCDSLRVKFCCSWMVVVSMAAADSADTSTLVAVPARESPSFAVEV